MCLQPVFSLKVLANEDTLLRTHCYRHKCFPVCPRAQHLLRTQILCPGHKNVSDFVQKHFVSATNVSQFARARKRHEQQCFRNKVSSFATAFRLPSLGDCLVVANAKERYGSMAEKGRRRDEPMSRPSFSFRLNSLSSFCTC